MYVLVQFHQGAVSFLNSKYFINMRGGNIDIKGNY